MFTVSFLARRAAEVRLAIRITVAGLVAFGLAWGLGMPQGYWAVITAVIVMQASLGASIKMAMDRFAGTIAGALWGGLISWLVPHQGGLMLAAVIGLALGPLSFLAAVNAAFRVAPVTALIVLLPTGAPVATEGPVLFALDRVLEIALGNAAGLAVALLVLPSRAQNLVAQAAATVMLRNAELMRAYLDAQRPGGSRPAVASIHAAIRAGLRRVEQAAEEASRERASHLVSGADPEPLIRTLYRVRHDLVMIGRASTGPFAPDGHPVALAAHHAGLAAAEALSLLARGLEEGRAVELPAALGWSIHGLSDAMDQSGGLSGLEGFDMARLFAYRFSLGELDENLAAMARQSALTGKA